VLRRFRTAYAAFGNNNLRALACLLPLNTVEDQDYREQVINK
jgi:hypothetical protein